MFAQTARSRPPKPHQMITEEHRKQKPSEGRNGVGSSSGNSSGTDSDNDSDSDSDSHRSSKRKISGSSSGGSSSSSSSSSSSIMGSGEEGVGNMKEY